MISLCLFKSRTFRSLLSTIILATLLVASPLCRQSAQAQSSQTPGFKTDRAVYVEPPLPVLPAAGGKFKDPTFGTEIMRATDSVDCPAPGCGTYYSHWPTFNRDNTYLLIRKSDSGAAIIKSFDPVNFTLGQGHQPGGVYVPGVGTVSINFESAIWHPTDPHLIYCFPTYYDGGMKLYTYNVVTKQYTLVKDFASLGGPYEYLHQMSMSADGDVFAWSQMQAGARSGDPIAYIVWRKSTDTVLYHVTAPPNQINEVRLDKSGKYLTIPYNAAQPDGRKYAVLTIATGAMDYGYWNATDSPTGHGDHGSGMSAGWDNWACGINKRDLGSIHSHQVVFRFQDANGVTDWTNDFHGSMLADDESWITIGTYDDPSITLPETGVFEDEIMQVNLDGSGQFRRIAHTRSAIDNRTDTTGYWAMPKPTVSRDGRFIAFTSNWEKSGRYDLFIIKIDPPNAAPGQTPSSPGLVSTAQTTALTLAGSSAATPSQINQLVASIEQAYNAFTAETSRFTSPAQVEMGLRAALYFSRAAAALSVAGGSSAGVQNRLQIASSYLTMVQSLMATGTSTPALSDGEAHAVSSAPFIIGPADTRSNASLAPLVAPRSIGVIIGDPNQSPLALQTKSATSAPNGQLPFELEGVSVTIGGQSAQLISISPSRVTFYVPAGLPNGESEVIVTTQDGYVSRGTTSVAALAPALFTESGSGSGAGVVMNAGSYARGSFDVTTALNLSADKRTRLMLLATGISNGAANQSAANDIPTGSATLINVAESVAVEARTSDGRVMQLPVEYAGAQGRFPGLDQVNFVLVPELKGAGNVELTVIVGTQRSNKVTVSIR
ncbi:MAG TPA: IPT/TIG domain-containing protein [Pyrinomonadaceae bacterium]|nr:IPT/TIG domain-containing protein [Pyrinomonadaceae bacterium]